MKYICNNFRFSVFARPQINKGGGNEFGRLIESKGLERAFS
jgi:hypothetical protein